MYRKHNLAVTSATAFAILLFATLVCAPSLLAEQPHIVVFLSDDHSQVDSSLYGNQKIPMPHLESLAADGMTFTHAFVASPSCAPSRAAMLTGLMPARNGAEGNHERPDKSVRSLVKDLQDAGYEVSAFGKVAHNNYAPQFGFDHIQTLGSIRVKHDDLLSAVTEYLQERDKTNPACVFVGTGNPHVPWPEKSRFEPKQVELPPHCLDTPETRRHRAAYYEEIRTLDILLGELRELAAKHLGDNTVFLHTSDHGSQWPFGKWNLYDYGTKVPFVAAWAGKIKSGTRSDAMISWVDLVPTLIEIGGGSVTEGIDGRSFKNVLLGKADSHREMIFTTHTGDKRKNVYPMRSLRTKRWKLIHNVHPDWAHTNHSDIDRKPLAGAYWHEWAELAKTDQAAKQIVDSYYRRTEYELFELTNDPWELNNVAHLPEHATRLATMKAELNAWMSSQGDTVHVNHQPRPLAEPKQWHPDFFEERLALEPQPPQKRRGNRQRQAKQRKTGVPLVDVWQRASRRPPKNWMDADFELDKTWTSANGGFGSPGTPGARIGSSWTSKNIWLRKEYVLNSIPSKPALLIHHDEDVKVFLNGRLVLDKKGFVSEYFVHPLEKDTTQAIKAGRNILAVQCKQVSGGQFVDVHLIDAENVPKLPPANVKPFESKLMTTWGEKVTAKNAWTEYPRPQLVRDSWTNLNGHWDYAVTPKDAKEAPPSQWDGKILVPYCLESKLGGVQKLLHADQSLWYRRSFAANLATDKRMLLNFEAVDYQCEVFVNGKLVGTHTGGNDPFSFDITASLLQGENQLTVKVHDATEAFQLRGKQKLEPRGIWYTRVSGIWQTVWLEEVASDHICDLKIKTDAASGTISVNPKTSNNGPCIVQVKDGEKVIATKRGAGELSFELANPKLWTPRKPHLYDITVKLLGATGQAVDQVQSYAGIRTVGKVKDADGHWRFTLNGKPIFHWGPLDQGWWPDGLLTPPSDEALLFDIEWLKAAGFNMIRKHIKVEPRRYYYHCDRLGMMVWQDQVSGGVGAKAWPKWTRLKPDPKDAQWPEQHHHQFMLELERMIASLENHPSIVCWVPFNERWGQHQTMDVGKWTVERDPSRLVNVASGGNFWPVGDIVDAHKYPHPEFPFNDGDGGRFDEFIKVMGEFGGHGYPVQGHLFDQSRRNWGYGGIPKNEIEYKQRYVTSLKLLNDLRFQGIAGGVYTQTTDVEGEINGLMTYDRKAIKIPAKELADLHRVLFKNEKVDPDIPELPDASDKQDKVESDAKAATADQFKKKAFSEVPTDRKPGPVMDAETIRSGLKSHDRALYIKAGWIRDPYITLGPDDFYYLTGTQPREGDPREEKNPYNIGLGDASIVGDQVRLWRSKDLVQWEYLGPIFTVDDTMKAKSGKQIPKKLIWAPEVHWLADQKRWALVHCPKRHSSLALSQGPELKGPWTHSMSGEFGSRHDPSIFTDEDGKRHLLWGNTMVAQLKDDLSGYASEKKGVRIDPGSTRPGPDGEMIRRIGHEGATMIKIGNKYVHLGTAWSTDKGRRGSYNLYYCESEKITGPYGPRKFAGRFLGHGTPFQTRDGKWWCTAFFNANVPPIPRKGIQTRDLSENAQTINEQGVTIVPLDIRSLENGEVYIRAKDPAYGNPGPDEAQKFDLEPKSIFGPKILTMRIRDLKKHRKNSSNSNPLLIL